MLRKCQWLWCSLFLFTTHAFGFQAIPPAGPPACGPVRSQHAAAPAVVPASARLASIGGQGAVCQCSFCRQQRRLQQQQSSTRPVPSVAPALAVRQTPVVSPGMQGRAVRPVSYTQEIVQPSMDAGVEYQYTGPSSQVYDSEYSVIHDGFAEGSSCCGSCSNGCCTSASSNCCCEQSGWWLSAEALYWWTSPSDVPALLTTSPAGTIQAESGILGLPGTTVLAGGGTVFGKGTPGLRFRGGRDFCDGLGIDGEFFALARETDDSFFSSNGDPILGRPFFNTLTGLQDAQLLGFPDLATGSLRARMDTRLYGAAIHLYRIADEDGSCRKDAFSAVVQAGPRFLNLKDGFVAEEFATRDNYYHITDLFQTENTFVGGEIGLQLRHRLNRFFWQVGGRQALGATQQELDVAGMTQQTSPAGTLVNATGGLLAQRTNSGHWSRNRFSAVPQLDLNLGWTTRWGWDITAGYSLLFWNNVLRATEQIDSTLNPNLFQLETIPLTGASRPAHFLRESDYLAHGITFGIEKRW
ncbi:MAG: BBP7 family outer membrane beta-barrel protein [Planctomycetaceae bacterium]